MTSPESGRISRRLEVPVLVAAALVIPVLVLEQEAHSPALRDVAQGGNWIIWTVFAAELAAVLWEAPKKLRALLHHPVDVLVVIATPPFMPAALQGARALRLLRLTRLLKLGTLTRGLTSAKGLRAVATITALVVIGGGIMFAQVEHDPSGHRLSDFDGIWWAVTTVTTVGYGDISPHTVAGRALAIAVMFAGIGFVALLTGSLAHRFIAHEATADAQVLARLDDLSDRLARLERPPDNT